MHNYQSIKPSKYNIYIKNTHDILNIVVIDI